MAAEVEVALEHPKEQRLVLVAQAVAAQEQMRNIVLVMRELLTQAVAVAVVV